MKRYNVHFILPVSCCQFYVIIDKERISETFSEKRFRTDNDNNNRELGVYASVVADTLLPITQKHLLHKYS